MTNDARVPDDGLTVGPFRRAAWYGRLSTKDKQDPTLSFPTQRNASEVKAHVMGARITAEFTDLEKGRRDDREGWSQLVAEARDKANRRFDMVIVYNTGRLGRDLMLSVAAERELAKLGVEVHYALEAGDPSTPEGLMVRRLFQVLDQYEVEKLGRETVRGLSENARQGYANGGRAPYGYRREPIVHPDSRRAKSGDTKSKHVPDPDEAEVVREIYALYLAGKGLGGIVEHLNRPGGPPAPGNVDATRNQGRRWAKSTVRYILRNPAYTGRIIWNVRDYRSAKLGQGQVVVRPEEEWVVSDERNDAIIADETFDAVQLEFARRERTEGSSRRRTEQKRFYAYRGHVRCATGHNPLNMFGKVVKGTTYYACTYAREYGATAAEAAGHRKTELIREDVLHDMILEFFAREVFGPERLARLREQHARLLNEVDPQVAKTERKLRKTLADLDQRIGAQIRAIEEGVEPRLVQRRIDELSNERTTVAAELRAVTEQRQELFDIEAACLVLESIPDLEDAMRDAPPELLRQLCEAFELSVEIDQAAGAATLKVFISSALAKAPTAVEVAKPANRKRRPVSAVSKPVIAGAGFEPATSGL
jgi:site-specific DNA recombinase